MCGVADRLVQTCCVAVPFSQLFPDVSWMQSVEKLGVIGILSGVVCMLIVDRRSMQKQLQTKSDQLDEMMERIMRQIDIHEAKNDQD